MKVGDILANNSYARQLESEEWKSFSSDIRKARGNFCECCRRSNVPTEIHHIFYEPGKKAWEHSEQDLVVLCSGCHRAFHQHLQAFRKNVFRLMRPEHLEILNVALTSGLKTNDPLEFVHAVSEMAKSPSSIKRFAYAWNDGQRPENRTGEYSPTAGKEIIETSWRADKPLPK